MPNGQEITKGQPKSPGLLLEAEGANLGLADLLSQGALLVARDNWSVDRVGSPLFIVGGALGSTPFPRNFLLLGSSIKGITRTTSLHRMPLATASQADCSQGSHSGLIEGIGVGIVGRYSVYATGEALQIRSSEWSTHVAG